MKDYRIYIQKNKKKLYLTIYLKDNDRSNKKIYKHALRNLEDIKEKLILNKLSTSYIVTKIENYQKHIDEDNISQNIIPSKNRIYFKSW